VLFVLPIVGHPLYSKRITMLQEVGFSVEAVAFERNHPEGRLPDCPVVRLGKLADGQYLRRILKLLAALPACRRAIRRSTVVFASGSDMAMFAVIAALGTGRPVIVEVADIQRIQVANGMKGWLVRLIEGCAVSRCRLMLVTAPGFVERYYRGWLHINTPTMVLENKLEASTARFDTYEIPPSLKGTPLLDRPLRIGYFGVLRCDWSWRVLEALASSRPEELEVVVAGYATNPKDLPERAARLANVEFRGAYASPGDLPKLYGDVDLVWACYPSPEVCDPKWRWAQAVCRSNRFYESCFFKKPILTMANSGDSFDVERYGIGIVIHNPEVQGIWTSLSNITLHDWTQLKANLSRLPRSVYTYTTEAEELAAVIRRMAADRMACD